MECMYVHIFYMYVCFLSLLAQIILFFQNLFIYLATVDICKVEHLLSDIYCRTIVVGHLSLDHCSSGIFPRTIVVRAIVIAPLGVSMYHEFFLRCRNLIFLSNKF